MKPVNVVKIIIDVLMTALLLLLMSYSLVGEELHEYLGAGMFIAFLIHQGLNISFYRNLFRGKYTLYRAIRTLVNILILCCMLGSMLSGVALSRYLFDNDFYFSAARTMHMLCAYWGFVMMSLHLGMHWNMIIGMISKMVRVRSPHLKQMGRAAGFIIAVYGAYAFYVREIGAYLFLRIQFVFFPFDQPVIYFLFDYLMVMGLFVWIGYYVSKWLMRFQKNINQEVKEN